MTVTPDTLPCDRTGVRRACSSGTATWTTRGTRSTN